jgi:NADH-quinone oxidoreductase subunit H
MLLILLKFIYIIVFVLISVAFFTHAERKILAAVQRRKGPNVVGVFGLLQPLADGFKLLVKEAITPSTSSKTTFVAAPLLTFIVSLLSWVVVPFDSYSVLAELNLGIIYVLASSSLGVYGIIVAGWSSNSKYAFLGAMRSAAQMISYEISIGFLICTIVMCVGSFNVSLIVEYQSRVVWFIVPFSFIFLLFFICIVAETNRHPFDLPEAEAELVAGYTVEYSAMKFALFSLGEYANILLMSTLTTLLFLGGWSAPFGGVFLVLSGSIWIGLKVSFFVVVFVLLRAGLPRFRYDQLMTLGWTVFLPMSISYFILVAFGLFAFNSLPF